MLLSNVLDIGGGCIPLPQLGTFLDFSQYTIAVQGVGGGTVSVDTKGEGLGGAPFLLTPRGRVWAGDASHGRDLFEILVQNTSIFVH